MPVVQPRVSLAKQFKRVVPAVIVLAIGTGIYFPVSRAYRGYSERAQEQEQRQLQLNDQLAKGEIGLDSVHEQFKPGHVMPDGTIYVGQYEPITREMEPLNKIFNVFAAPRNLPRTMTFDNTVKFISMLKNWNGYDGSDYKNDTELFAALKDGSYKGGWIIPTSDILYGRDFEGRETTKGNIYKHQRVDGFAGSFAFSNINIKDDYPHIYLSLTKDNASSDSQAKTLDFYHGTIASYKDNYTFSCRPVRLVEAKKPALSPKR